MSWERYRIDELVSRGMLLVGDGYRAKLSELGRPGLPFIRAGNVREGLSLNVDDYLRDDRAAVAGEKVGVPGDVVFTSKGTVGRFAWVPPGTPPFVYSPQLCYWRTLRPDWLDPRYLYYWMSGPDFRRQFKAVAGQTDMAEYVSLSDQRRMELPVPPIDEQRRIASILGALDDKIALNRRMNKTLTGLRRAHFQRLEGESFKPVGDLATVRGGSTPSTRVAEYWNGRIPWVTPKDLSRLSSPVLLNTERQITEQGARQISSGVLPVGTVLLSSRAPIGYLAISEVPVAVNQGFIAMVPDKGIPSLFLLSWAESAIDEIKARANGTTFQEISKRNFRPITVRLPSVTTVNEFDALVKPLHRLMVSNDREIERLVALRDILLPRLVSGPFRVSAAQSIVGSASGVR